ncbi:MAG: hypothetical protein K5931_09660 [Lachnospiraceae bacterium]|nr:hypothetical protein [Lachnospiraceae bacterium]
MKEIKMTAKDNLSDEQKTRIHQLEFLYKEAESSPKSSSIDNLYDRLLKLDEDVKRKAFKISLIDGFAGTLLLISGYNFLTKLSGAFLSGIIFFCIGFVMLALTYPIYNYLLKKGRKKYAPVVLTITNYLN